MSSLGHTVALISVLSKLKFFVMYWPGMGASTKIMGARLLIVVELLKEKMAELEKNREIERLKIRSET